MKNTYAAFLRYEISTVPYISLFYYQQTHTVIFIFFSCAMDCISNIYFYIVPYMFSFIFNWSQSKASVVNQMSHLFFEARGYYFAFFNFLKMVIFTTLFWRWSTLWNSTLKITALFWHCLTLLISTLNWRCSTLQISTLIYTTLFQRWFDIALRRDVISH